MRNLIEEYVIEFVKSQYRFRNSKSKKVKAGLEDEILRLKSLSDIDLLERYKYVIREEYDDEKAGDEMWHNMLL